MCLLTGDLCSKAEAILSSGKHTHTRSTHQRLGVDANEKNEKLLNIVFFIEVQMNEQKQSSVRIVSDRERVEMSISFELNENKALFSEKRPYCEVNKVKKNIVN